MKSKLRVCCKCFPQFSVCLSILLYIFLDIQISLSIYLANIQFASKVPFKLFCLEYHFPSLRSQKYSPVFSHSFVVLLYSFKCLIHPKLCLPNVVRWEKSLCFSPECVVFIKWWRLSSLIRNTSSIILYISYLGFIFCLLDLFIFANYFGIVLIFYLFEYLYSIYYPPFFVSKIFLFVLFCSSS